MLANANSGNFAAAHFDPYATKPKEEKKEEQKEDDKKEETKEGQKEEKPEVFIYFVFACVSF